MCNNHIRYGPYFGPSRGVLRDVARTRVRVLSRVHRYSHEHALPGRVARAEQKASRCVSEHGAAPADLEASLGYNLYRASMLFRRELTSALAEYEMTPEQWQVLTALHEFPGPVNQAVLVPTIQKDKHTLSRIIARLARDGWVEKADDPNDARATCVSLSAKGRRTFPVLRKLVKDHFRRWLHGLSEHDRAELMNRLRALRELLGDL